MPERGPECPGGWPGPRHADGPLDAQNHPPSPELVFGGGDREGLGPEERVGAPGVLVSAWGRGEGLPPHSFPLMFPLVGTPARRPPAAQVRLGCSALVLRPPPSGEQPPGCPGAAVCASCQCPRPTGTLTGGRREGLPELCLLASPGSGGAGPRGGRGFPRCSLSRPVWPGLPRPP